MGFTDIFKNPATYLFGIDTGMKLYEGEQNRDLQRESNDRSERLAREQMAKQEEFAKMGIRWKVDDAVAAGLHPLAALGTTGPSFSPVSAVFNAPVEDRYSRLSEMGQNIARAVRSGETPEERMASQLRLENMRLQNKLLESQISSVANTNSPPVPVAGGSGFIDGQGDGRMVVKPSERVMSAPGRPAQEAGWRPGVSYFRSDTGLVPVIPQGISESMESEGVFGTVPWMIRYKVAPNFGIGDPPPRSMLPRGADGWRWDRFGQEWQPYRGGRRSFSREVYEKFRYGR